MPWEEKFFERHKTWINDYFRTFFDVFFRKPSTLLFLFRKLIFIWIIHSQSKRNENKRKKNRKKRKKKKIENKSFNPKNEGLLSSVNKKFLLKTHWRKQNFSSDLIRFYHLILLLENDIENVPYPKQKWGTLLKMHQNLKTRV